MVKAVIFDLDGTLTDSDKVHFQVFQEIFAGYGIALDKALYKKQISGRQNAAILADFLPQLSVEEGEAFSEQKESREWSELTFSAISKGGLLLFTKRQLTPLPGLLDLLAQLNQQSLPAAVVTNAPTKNANFMLETLQLNKAFSPVVIADELPRGKPDPLPYQTALEQLGIQPEEAIAFEDSTAGIRSAVGAGILTVGMTTTHQVDELKAVGATYAIADFTDPLIQTLL